MLCVSNISWLAGIRSTRLIRWGMEGEIQQMKLETDSLDGTAGRTKKSWHTCEEPYVTDS